jgi:hypothetical protein
MSTTDGQVFAAFLAVQADLEAIGKNKRVTEGPARFSFRGVDDVMNALHAPMAKHGLICVPQVQERVPETRATSKGGTMNVLHLRVRFTFYAADGSSFFCETWGEGQDSGDKATGKAHSMAYKSALLQAFHIPTDDVPDADYDTTPAAPPERHTDAAWIDGFRQRITACGTPGEVRGLREEALQVWAEYRLTQDDAKALKAEMDAREAELVGEPVPA